MLYRGLQHHSYTIMKISKRSAIQHISSLCQRQCQVESHEVNEVSFSHFPLTLTEIGATSSEWLLANQFEEIIWKRDTLEQ